MSCWGENDEEEMEGEEKVDNFGGEYKCEWEIEDEKGVLSRGESEAVEKV